MPLSCPLQAGHTSDYAHESFTAKIIVRAFERSFLSSFYSLFARGTVGDAWKWREVECVEFENAALEFGGGWNHFYEQSLNREKVE